MEAIQLVTLNEAFSDYATKGGLFSNIGNLPWSSIMVGTQMDILYFDSHSGERYGSNIIAKRVGDDNSLSTQDRRTIATLIYARFRAQWNRLWATMNPTYDPMTNYQMQETAEGTENSVRTPDLIRGDTGTVQTSGQDKRTPNLIKGDTGTVQMAGSDTRTANLTHTDSGTISDDGSATNTNQNGIWGFNSSNSVSSDMSDGTSTANNTNTRDLTQKDTGTDETVHSNTDTYNREYTEKGTDTTERTNTDTYNRSYTETGTDTTAGTSSHKLTRSGNIGTNTFQNLIQQERNIWMYDFFEQIFKDVDSVLTIPIY